MFGLAVLKIRSVSAGSRLFVWMGAYIFLLDPVCHNDSSTGSHCAAKNAPSASHPPSYPFWGWFCTLGEGNIHELFLSPPQMFTKYSCGLNPRQLRTVECLVNVWELSLRGKSRHQLPLKKQLYNDKLVLRTMVFGLYSVKQAPRQLNMFILRCAQDAGLV